MTDRPTVPPIGEVPEAPGVASATVGELEHLLERPGDYVARAWSEEAGSEGLDSWRGSALRELVRRLRSRPVAGAAPGERPTPDLPEVVYAGRAAWRRGPAGHYLRLGPDGRETVVALTLGQLAGLPGGVRVLTLGQLAGLPGGVRVCPDPPSSADEDALGQAAYEAFGAATPQWYLPWERVEELLPEIARRWREVAAAVVDALPPDPSPPRADGGAAYGQLAFERYSPNSGAGRWVLLTTSGCVVGVESYDLDADVRARTLAEQLARELR